jgi:putative two-component system response regulator
MRMNLASHVADSAVLAPEGSTHRNPNGVMGRPSGIRSSSSQQTQAWLGIFDRDPQHGRLVRRMLVNHGFPHIVTAADCQEAIELVRKQALDVVVIDAELPNEGGLECLAQIRQMSPEIPVLFAVHAEDTTTKRIALERGVNDFLYRPMDPAELILRVSNALALKAHREHFRNWQDRLEREVQLRTVEMQRTRLEVIYCLGRAAEYRDQENGRHVIRVSRYAGLIARTLDLPSTEAILIEEAAPLHDIGKIGVPDHILLKPTRLDADELAQMRKHCNVGAQLCDVLDDNDGRELRRHTQMGQQLVMGESSVLKMAGVIALSHHERWDGKGYPLGLSGEHIPLPGRIVAVADAFDALSSRRPYRAAFPLDKCFEILRSERGQQFDPKVVDAFLICIKQVMQIHHDLGDLE